MAKVNLKPLGGNLLVKPVVEKSVSGIVLPDTIDKEKPQKGEVIALGTGKLDKDGKKIAFNVKVGDIVLFKKYSPDEVEFDGNDYLIMDEDAILAILS
jgi:chaperonin GroES